MNINSLNFKNNEFLLEIAAGVDRCKFGKKLSRRKILYIR